MQGWSFGGKSQGGPSPTQGTLCMCIDICVPSDCPVFKIYLSADSSQMYLSVFPVGLCTCLSGKLLSLN